MRYPRILTCSSARPKYCNCPSTPQRTKSPVRYIRAPAPANGHATNRDPVKAPRRQYPNPTPAPATKHTPQHPHPANPPPPQSPPPPPAPATHTPPPPPPAPRRNHLSSTNNAAPDTGTP